MKKEIMKLLYEYDFGDLAILRVPEDEYEYEAEYLFKKLISLTNSGVSNEELIEAMEKEILYIFSYSFEGLIIMNKRYFNAVSDLAKEICNIKTP